MRKRRDWSLRRPADWKAVLAVLLLAGAAGFGAGCAANELSRVRSEDVRDALAAAEAAVEQAQAEDLARSARSALQQAQAKLEQARRAYRDGELVRALRAAEEAKVHAQQALLLDAQADSYEAVLRDQAEQYQRRLRESERQAQEAAQAVEEFRKQLQLLRQEVERFRQETERLEAQRREAERQAQRASEELRRMEARVAELSRQLEEAQSEKRLTQEELDWLQAQLDRAQAELAARQLEAQRAARRASEVEQEAQTLAQQYSEKIRLLEQQQRQEAALERARRRAQEVHPPAQLPEEEIRAATPQVQQWKAAWENGKIEEHLNYYAPNARGLHVVVRNGQETETLWNREQLLQAIRQSDPNAWTPIPRSTVLGEGSYVIGQLAYRRKATAADGLSFWVRRSYWSRQAGQWRIVREEWRLYEDVPTFQGR